MRVLAPVSDERKSYVVAAIEPEVQSVTESEHVLFYFAIFGSAGFKVLISTNFSRYMRRLAGFIIRAAK